MTTNCFIISLLFRVGKQAQDDESVAQGHKGSKYPTPMQTYAAWLLETVPLALPSIFGI